MIAHISYIFFIWFSHINTHLVVHLFGAVEHVDHDAEGTTQILGGLGFTGSCWSGRGTTHDQVEGLSQCDVTSAITQRNHIT